MTNETNFSRPRANWRPVLLSLMLAPGLVKALPTAVNDSFSGVEDAPIIVGAGATVLNATFDPAPSADGFTYVADGLGTSANGFNSSSIDTSTGFNGTGALHVRVGPRSPQNAPVLPISGAWNRVISVPSAGTYTISFKYRVEATANYDANEFIEGQFRVNGTRYGGVAASGALAGSGVCLYRHVGDGNGGTAPDTGFVTYSENIPLTAGNSTLTFGLYNSTVSGTSFRPESSDFYLDEVSVVSVGGGQSGVLANDTGTAPVTAVKETDPANGTVVLNSDGTFTYTPAANYFGTDTFTYRAVDGSGSSAPATVTLTLTGVNDAPVASNDAYTTTEDTALSVNAALGVLANDSDPDGTTPTAELRAPTANGTLTLNPNGSFDYTPNANFFGTDTFSYRANDGTLVSADRTVTITVNAVNDPPVAVADSYRTNLNTPLNVTLPGGGGIPVRETLVAAGSPVALGAPAEATLPVWRYLDNGSDQGTAWRNPGFNDSAWATGKAELGYGDGPERTVVGFGPNANARYATTYFRTTFTASNLATLSALGLELMRDDAAAVYLNGTEIYRDQAANGFPDIPANPAYNAYTANNTSISAGDEAALRDLSAFLVSNASQYLVEGTNTLAVEIHQASGTSSDISMDLRLTVLRTPQITTTTETLVAAGSPVALGDPAEVDLPDWKYLDNGSDQGTAWRLPAYNDSTWATGKGELGYGDGPERTVVGFGPDSANKFATTYFRTAFNVVDKSTLSSLTLELMRDDAAVVYLNGTEIYRDQAANGLPDLPQNPAFDAYSGGSVSGTDEAQLVNLTSLMVPNAAQYLVEGVNVIAVEVHQANGPSTDLSMDLKITAQRSPYTGVLANDSDVETSSLVAQLVTGPAHGTLSLNANGTFLYTPANGYVGADSFVYRASDGTANSANTTVTLTIVGTGNLPPAATADAYAIAEDTTLNVNAPGVLTNDTDPEGGALTAQLIAGPARGTLTLNANGSFTYLADANYFGPDSFTYRARDASNASSNTVTVTLTVNSVNDAPIAVADNYGTNVGQTLSVPVGQGVLSNDSDIEGSNLSAQLVSGPASGTLSLFANGSFTYVPPAGFSGTRTFVYRASDGSAFSANTTVTIAINGAPTAGNDAYSTAEDTTLTVSAPGLLSNDSDPEASPLTAQVALQPAHGTVTVNANGSFSYIPALNYAGSDSFTYQANDGSRLSLPATVTLTVTPVNDAPVAVADSYIAVPDQTLSVPTAEGLLSNDSDPENSPLILSQLTSPANGALSLSPDGSFSYVPNVGFIGSDTFSYRVSDGALLSNPVNVTLTVAQGGADIVINEIMYRPGGGYPENTAREFIELYNRGNNTINLTGWTISAGVTYAFPSGRTMAPGSFLVIAADVAAFQAAYPGVTNVIGGWTGTLSNGGEKIELTDASGEAQDSVSYASEGDWAQRIRETTYNGWDWSTLADGGNRSMELRNPSISNDNGQNWSVSSTIGGTPGSVNDSLTANIAPIVKAVKHSPAIPTSSDRVIISCELNDESSVSALTATLFWRDVTSTSPGAFQSLPMSSDGKGGWFAPLDPKANLTIIEFYISASDGLNTRTWPAPTSEGQNANCQYLVTNEAISPVNDMYFMIMTAAENAAFVTTTASDSSGNKIDRQFNNTLVVLRGGESSIHYRCDMRIRGNSSRDHTIGGQPAPPMRFGIPSDDSLDGSNKFNINPRSAPMQYFGMRCFQAAGLRAPDAIPIELRRNGVEQSSTSSTTGNFGMWVRMEDVGGELVNNHWPLADGGGAYKKGRSDWYWRSTQPAPSTPDGVLDGFLKQNNSAANDWTDLTGFFSTWMAASAPHFPGASAGNVSGSTGGSTTGNGNWNNTPFTPAEYATLETVADFDQWARWFAVMTILQDNETNVSNGQDDDYAVYFEPKVVSGVPRRRLQFIAHDLDTIFGLGDSPLAYNGRGLYDMTDDTFVFRPLLPLFGNTATPGYADFRTKYHNALRELLGTVFEVTDSSVASQPFNAFIDYHLGAWLPAATRTTIKDFVRQRRTHLLSLIGSGATTPPPGTSNATLTSAHGTLMISEILASNVSTIANAGLFPDVVELRNTGAAAVNLAGMSLTDDPLLKTKYVFPAGTTIAAGGFLTLYADAATTAPGIHLGFSLSNDGDALYLYSTVGAGQGIVDSVTFGLQPADLSIGRTGADLNTWALCTPTIGAPNTAVATLADPATLKINEWLGNADYRASDDFIEVYNGAAQPVAVGGMSLTDDFINFPFRGTLPALSFMGAGSWIEFEAKGSSATPGNARELPFGIDSTIGSVAMVGANGTVVDRADTVSQFRDLPTGRLPDGTGPFGTLSPPTPGFANGSLSDTATDLLNFLRITELMYNPSSSSRSEYIEFRNISDLTGTPIELDLSGVVFKNGITYTFPTPTLLPAGGYFLLVGDAARFQAQFPSVPVGGVFTGSLANGGERLRFDIAGNNVAILDFTYSDGWYPSTDGGGDALQIASATATPAQWDKKSGWQASPPNPGSVPAFSIYAGPDSSTGVGIPVYLDGALSPGATNPGLISLAWSQDSGPGTASFTTGNYTDANATFPLPGVYVLRLTATAPGPVTVTDTVTVAVYQTYNSWAASALSGLSPANQLAGADPDNDGVSNIAEFVLGGNPLSGASTGMPVPMPVDGKLAFTWQRNLLSDPAIQIVPQLSEDLQSWQQGPNVLDTVKTGSTSTSETWVSSEAGTPGARGRVYMRVAVVQP